MNSCARKWILVAVSCVICVRVQSQVITSFAGNGTASGISGDGGPATVASINGCNGGAFDKHGNYYVAEVNGHRVRKITPSGIITTVAGTGSSGYSGDGMAATLSKLTMPSSVQLDNLDNIYIVDGNNYRIRRVDALTGIISTIAGNGIDGFNGDDIPATNAQISLVEDLCIDNVGNLYFTDKGNYRVRKIGLSGIITTIAGHGVFHAVGTGDGGLATAATFNWLAGLVVDDAGNVFVADFNGAKIRKISTTGIITTVAGNGNYTYIGDGMPATNAQFNPARLAFDRSKNLVIADKHNRRILKIDNAGTIHNIAGNGVSAFAGDGGPATGASFDFPAGVVYDTCGNLYIAEATNRRVRKVSFNPTCAPIGVREINRKVIADIQISPNPANNELIVTTPDEIKSVSVVDMVGQVVETSHLPIAIGTPREREVLLDIQHLPAGVYVVWVNGIYFRKFVKE